MEKCRSRFGIFPNIFPACTNTHPTEPLNTTTKGEAFSQMLIKRVKFLRVFRSFPILFRLCLSSKHHKSGAHTDARQHQHTDTSTYGRNRWKSVSNALLFPSFPKLYSKYFSSTFLPPRLLQRMTSGWRKSESIFLAASQRFFFPLSRYEALLLNRYRLFLLHWKHGLPERIIPTLTFSISRWPSHWHRNSNCGKRWK